MRIEGSVLEADIVVDQRQIVADEKQISGRE
jgi:hypothetical protein